MKSRKSANCTQMSKQEFAVGLAKLELYLKPNLAVNSTSDPWLANPEHLAKQ